MTIRFALTLSKTSEYNCNKTKDFVGTKPCAPEIAAGISLPILLISVSKPETTFSDWDINSNASGRDFKS